MSPDHLRTQALNLANQRAKPGATLQKVLADAETVLAWLKQGSDVVGTEIDILTATEPSQHESVAAVAGQEPKGE